MKIRAITSFVAITITLVQAAFPLSDKGCQCLSDCKVCKDYHSVSTETISDSLLAPTFIRAILHHDLISINIRSSYHLCPLHTHLSLYIFSIVALGLRHLAAYQTLFGE